MAIVTLTPEQATLAGEPVTIHTPANSVDTFKFVNDGKTALLAIRAAGGTSILTFTTPKTEKGLAVAEHAVTIQASSSNLIGPFDRDLFNDEDGLAAFTINAITGLTFAAVRVA